MSFTLCIPRMGEASIMFGRRNATDIKGAIGVRIDSREDFSARVVDECVNAIEEFIEHAMKDAA